MKSFSPPLERRERNRTKQALNVLGEKIQNFDNLLQIAAHICKKVAAKAEVIEVKKWKMQGTCLEVNIKLRLIADLFRIVAVSVHTRSSVAAVHIPNILPEYVR